MYLINTETICLEHFPDESGLEYAILSHRWEKDEVSFLDIQSPNTAQLKTGFGKIQQCCNEASRRGYKYAWVDTCCIDKSSSAELSEAINSMYRWYKNAAECYVYLSDVHENGLDALQEFRKSQWFQRGWTLQELLAPSKVLFFNRDWNHFGVKHKLVNEINQITGINKGAIYGRRNILSFSVAQRMAWAADRKTTRIEDRAYSLMGLFNINMPMLYGEGNKAFLRLQEEIMKRSNDHSILAWTGVPAGGCGLLAARPEYFAQSGSILDIIPDGKQEPYMMTNRGLSIEAYLTPWAPSVYLALLGCGIPSVGRVGIFLQRLSSENYRRVRQNDNRDFMVDTRAVFSSRVREMRMVQLWVQQDDLASSIQAVPSFSETSIYGIKIQPSQTFKFVKFVTSKGVWNSGSKIARLNPGEVGTVANLKFEKSPHHVTLVQFSFDFDFRLRCLVCETLCFNADKSADGIVSSSITEATSRESFRWVRALRHNNMLEIEPCTESSRKGIYNSDIWACEVDLDVDKCIFQLIKRRVDNEWVDDALRGIITINSTTYDSKFVRTVKIELEDYRQPEADTTSNWPWAIC